MLFFTSLFHHRLQMWWCRLSSLWYNSSIISIFDATGTIGHDSEDVKFEIFIKRRIYRCSCPVCSARQHPGWFTPERGGRRGCSAQRMRMETVSNIQYLSMFQQKTSAVSQNCCIVMWTCSDATDCPPERNEARSLGATKSIFCQCFSWKDLKTQFHL